jgi:CopG family transcriptional regulator, nickel-responsive regulator
MAVSRFGVSLDQELLKELDDYAHINLFANRSQAIRHLIEKFLVEEKWKCHNIVAGAIILVFGKDRKDVVSRITDISNLHSAEVLSLQVLNLNEMNNMVIVAVKGPSSDLTSLSEELISIKGIQHGKLVMSKSG